MPGMTVKDIQVLAKGFGPIVQQFVAERLAPIERRLDALEAAQSGTVKSALPVVRVPAIRGATR